MTTSERFHHRILELDGVRGVAILLVVFAHSTVGVFPHYRGIATGLTSFGGLVGVQLFFVLSGMLITRLLMEGPPLLGFYGRRLGRLYPTLVVVVAAGTIWSGDVAGALRALTYTENLIPVMDWTDQHLPGGRVLGHTWSLAVEEQFYLVWPIALAATARYAARAALMGIVLTIAARQYSGWSDAAVYQGLRWDALLAGCLLALVGWRASRAAGVAGAVVILLYTVGAVDSLSNFDYVVSTLACVLVVASATSFRCLSTAWLVHLGRISYAWYLWHVLIMRVDVPATVTVPAGLLLAEVTYALVDRRTQMRRTAMAVAS